MRVVLFLKVVSAVACAGFAGTGYATMRLVTKGRETERRVAKLEADLDRATRRPKAAPLVRPQGRDPEKEIAQFAERCRALESRISALLRENASLRQELAASRSAAGKPAGHAPENAPPLAPEAPAQSWGATDNGEIDELAGAVKLDQDQRTKVRTIIMSGQNEFERLLIEAGKRGERDIAVIERIGEEISKKTEADIDAILRPDQRPAFRDLMRKKRDENEK